jgi:hypothetical protein
MMMTSGSGVNYKSMFDAGSQVTHTSLSDLFALLTTDPFRSLPRKESGLSSRVPVPTSCVVLPARVSFRYTTSSRRCVRQRRSSFRTNACLQLMFGKVYSGGASFSFLPRPIRLILLCRIRLNSTRLMDSICRGVPVYASKTFRVSLPRRYIFYSSSIHWAKHLGLICIAIHINLSDVT